jgi:hypothetical protein
MLVKTRHDASQLRKFIEAFGRTCILVLISANNPNTNFGGAKRRGYKNVFESPHPSKKAQQIIVVDSIGF